MLLSIYVMGNISGHNIKTVMNIYRHTGGVSSIHVQNYVGRG